MVESSEGNQGSNSSAFKMADFPFYSQALLAYKKGPLLRERGCVKWKESLLKEREIFLYVCFSVLSIAMCVSETNKRICMVFAFERESCMVLEK